VSPFLKYIFFKAMFKKLKSIVEKVDNIHEQMKIFQQRIRNYKKESNRKVRKAKTMTETKR
jgi:hypothetical protein